jgi:hypothetical protein
MESSTVHLDGVFIRRFSSIDLLSSSTVTGVTNLTILGISMRRMDTVLSRQVDFAEEVSEAVPVRMAEVIANPAAYRIGDCTPVGMTAN